MLVTATIIPIKTLRDREGPGEILNKIEDAGTEQLLMRLDRNGGRACPSPPARQVDTYRA